MTKYPEVRHNIKFSLIGASGGIDENTNLPVGDAVVASDVPGLLADIANTQEAYRSMATDGQQFRILTKCWPPDVVAETFTNKLLQITHKKRTRLPGWTSVTDGAKYRVVLAVPVMESDDQELYLVCELLGSNTDAL